MNKLITFTLMLFTFAANATETVEYRDYDVTSNTFLTRLAECQLVTSTTTEFADGGWYAAQGTVTCGAIEVMGAAHLVLCDGCELTVNGGIGVNAGKSLTIYGQSAGTGKLTAIGAYGLPGIGGGDKPGSSGTLTVRGGVVTAYGGEFAAGIGGGSHRAGAVVTINGGEVTAYGGKFGAGIGGGSFADGGTVMMTGGAIKAIPGERASDIGSGSNNESPSHGTVMLFGGAFWKRPNGEWIASGHVVSENPDPAMRSSYPYRVTAPLVRVTVPHDNFNVRWTGDPLSVTNNLTSASFTVPQNTSVELFYEVMNGATYKFGELHRVVQVGNQDLTVENPPIASIPPIEYVDEHGVLKTNEYYRLLGPFDRTLQDGWYAITQTTMFDSIEIAGDVHLILCDGQELTANGGVGVDAGKSLTVYGQSAGSGKLTSRGSQFCAGIGGRNPSNWRGYGNCGSITINGGIVTAQGGDSAAGIGGGKQGSGGIVTINGGTVKATGSGSSKDIGAGGSGIGGTVTINGGSIAASSFSAVPKNAAGEVLHKVTIPFPEGMVYTQLVRLSGVGDYGTFGIYPIDNKLLLYLPDGEYRIRITVQGGSGMCVAVVNGKDVVVEYVALGFTINGTDIAEGRGDGWIFTEQNQLMLTNAQEYVLSGYFTNATMSVSVEANATVVLSNATVLAVGMPAMSVADAKNVDLKMSGLVSYLGSTNNVEAIRLGDGAKLKVSTASGMDLLATIGVFNYDDAPAIAGDNGSVEVAGGSFLVWAAETAVEGELKLADGLERPLIMKTGVDPETARFAESYQGEACLCVAPRFAITLPECDGIQSVVVSNDVEKLVEVSNVDGNDGTRVFSGMLTDMVTIDFTAAEDCEILSGEHIFIPSLTNDLTVGSAECPWPELRKWIFTVTIPDVPNAKHQLETTDARVLTKDGHAYQIASNSAVKVTFQAAPNYRLTTNRDMNWILTGNVIFGTTDGFSLPEAEAIYGMAANPWLVGEGVSAYTNEFGQLIISGSGAMNDFTNATDVPWVPAAVNAVMVESGVTKIGANAWAAFSDEVLINDESIKNRKLIADGFAPSTPQSPSGYITPANPDAIEIIDGKAYLSVSVATNANLEVESANWGKANIQSDGVSVKDGSVIIAVPATAEQGFMIIKSNP